MKIGGPIEACIVGASAGPHAHTFPPMKIGGPIEAEDDSVDLSFGLKTFPPMKIGGPIEAYHMVDTAQPRYVISADENRRPH